MQTERIEYSDNGVVLEAHVAYPDMEGQRPVVLVSHAWAGRDSFEDNKAEALAELGYVGFALDLYGKGVLGSSVEENTALMSPFLEDREMLRKRITSALNTACKLERVDPSAVGAIGFCFGGLCVLDLARSGADVKGVVSFHGLFNLPENLPNEPIKAKVLALHGQDDPMVPPEMVAALAKGTDRCWRRLANPCLRQHAPCLHESASQRSRYGNPVQCRCGQTLLDCHEKLLRRSFVRVQRGRWSTPESLML